MDDKFSKIYIAIALLVITLVVWMVFGNANTPTENNSNSTTNNQLESTDVGDMRLANNATLGNILTDGKGMTLYYFSKDVPGKSNCFGECVTAWPLFNPTEFSAPAGFNSTDFTAIDRGDGTFQLAYKEWPLYYYFKDTKPGDTLGENVGGVWFVVTDPFYDILIVNKEPYGSYLSDEKGMALYYFARDTFGTATSTPVSNCAKDCLVNWPPFYAEISNLKIPSSMSKSDFTELTTPDGRGILAYKGMPLYHYINDSNPGDTNGQNIGEVWFLVKP